MKSAPLLKTSAASLLLCAITLAAQDKGYWRAASTDATAITSDIAIFGRSVSIDYISFPLAQIRKLTTAEVAAAFDADVNAGGNGTLYRLNIPAAKRFQHKNTLCGTEDTQWMATYVSGRNLQVAFFSGSDAPLFTFEALSKSPDLCGTFTYAR